MSDLGRWEIDSVLTFPANTHADTGEASDADSAPSYRVYEEETATPILTGTMALLDSANTIGFYSEQLALSAANGFEQGKSYLIYIAAAVGGILGTMAYSFRVASAPATAAALATVDGKLDALATSVDSLPTNAELDAALANADNAVLAAIAALNNLSTANVDAALAAVGLSASVMARLDVAVSTRLAAAGYTAPDNASIASILTASASILTDTSELQADWTNGGRLDLLLDAIKVVTDALPQGGALTTLLGNVAAILADTGTDGVVVSQATRQAIADEVLGRSAANVEATAPIYTLAGMILAAFESSVDQDTGIWTIKRTDGITNFGTRTVSTDIDAEPITGVS